MTHNLAKRCMHVLIASWLSLWCLSSQSDELSPPPPPGARGVVVPLKTTIPKLPATAEEATQQIIATTKRLDGLQKPFSVQELREVAPELCLPLMAESLPGRLEYWSVDYEVPPDKQPDAVRKSPFSECILINASTDQRLRLRVGVKISAQEIVSAIGKPHHTTGTDSIEGGTKGHIYIRPWGSLSIRFSAFTNDLEEIGFHVFDRRRD